MQTIKARQMRAKTRMLHRAVDELQKKWQLVPHQHRMFELSISGKLPPVMWLWWKMGTGKTLSALLCTI